jgi:hypothetical protein
MACSLTASKQHAFFIAFQEPTLVDYVVKLLSQRSTPEQLHAELSPVLDSDTDTFVLKLYRMGEPRPCWPGSLSVACALRLL